MPPPELAELLEKTLLLTVNVPPAVLQMPTTTVAELSIKLLSVTVAVLKLLMPPPQPTDSNTVSRVANDNNAGLSEVARITPA